MVTSFITDAGFIAWGRWGHQGKRESTGWTTTATWGSGDLGRLQGLEYLRRQAVGLGGEHAAGQNRGGEPAPHGAAG